jgi:Tol biopolymer transport system component
MIERLRPNLPASVVLVAAAAVGALAGSATAAHPGKNGAIAFVRGVGTSDGDLYTTNAGGATAAMLVKPSDGADDPEWSPDGNELVYVNWPAAYAGELWIYDAAHGTSRRLAAAGTGLRSPTWSPDGKQIAYVKFRNGNLADASIWVIGSDGSNPHQIRDYCGAIGDDLAWGPTNRLAFEAVTSCAGDPPRGYSGWSLLTMDPDGGNVQKVRDTRGLSAGNDTPHTEPMDGILSLDWSPDGKRLLVVGGWNSAMGADLWCGSYSYIVWDIWSVDAADGSLVDLTKSPYPLSQSSPSITYRSAAWSPDGSRIVVSLSSETCKAPNDAQFQRPRLYTMSAGGGPLKQLTNETQAMPDEYTDPAQDNKPAWQPCTPKTVRCLTGGAGAASKAAPAGSCTSRRLAVVISAPGRKTLAAQPCWAKVIRTRPGGPHPCDRVDKETGFWVWNEIQSPGGATSPASVEACAVSHAGASGIVFYAANSATSGFWSTTWKPTSKTHVKWRFLELYGCGDASCHHDVASQTLVHGWLARSSRYAAMINVGGGASPRDDQAVYQQVLSVCKSTKKSVGAIGLYWGTAETAVMTSGRLSKVTDALNACMSR